MLEPSESSLSELYSLQDKPRIGTFKFILQFHFFMQFYSISIHLFKFELSDLLTIFHLKLYGSVWNCYYTIGFSKKLSYCLTSKSQYKLQHKIFRNFGEQWQSDISKYLEGGVQLLRRQTFNNFNSPPPLYISENKIIVTPSY